jgi:hypothetical protein
MKRVLVALILGVVCSFAALLTTRAEGPAGKVLKPCVAITGADSHVTKCRYQRIVSADDWARVWQEHKGEKPTGKYDLFYDSLALPLIGFDDFMVIAIFQGDGSNNAGFQAVSIVEEDTRIVFRFRDKGYQTMSRYPGNAGRGGRKATAYGFFVLPRSKKPLVLEEGQFPLSGDPPLWHERITFPKL